MNEIEKIAELLKEKVPNKTWQPKILAKEIYDMICKDKVVLTEEEWRETFIQYRLVSDLRQQARKETARKILKSFEYCNATTFYKKWKKLCKQYGVEIE